MQRYPGVLPLLLRAVLIARRHRDLAESTRREYRRRLEKILDIVIALAPNQRDGKRLRKRYAKLREHLFTFLDHPEVTADNNASKRDLRPTATYRKVTGGFRSNWGADLFAVVGTATRGGIYAYQAIRDTLSGQSVLHRVEQLLVAGPLPRLLDAMREACWYADFAYPFVVEALLWPILMR